MNTSQQIIALPPNSPLLTSLTELHHTGFPSGEARNVFLREAHQMLHEYRQDEENYAPLEDLEDYEATEDTHVLRASFPHPLYFFHSTSLGNRGHSHIPTTS